jgi:hypothetical protein
MMFLGPAVDIAPVNEGNFILTAILAFHNQFLLETVYKFFYLTVLCALTDTTPVI